VVCTRTRTPAGAEQGPARIHPHFGHVHESAALIPSRIAILPPIQLAAPPRPITVRGHSQTPARLKIAPREHSQPREESMPASPNTVRDQGSITSPWCHDMVRDRGVLPDVLGLR